MGFKPGDIVTFKFAILPKSLWIVYSIIPGPETVSLIYLDAPNLSFHYTRLRYLEKLGSLNTLEKLIYNIED